MTRRAAGMICVEIAVLGILLGACGTASSARTASPTATTPPTPTASPMPTSGRWQSAAQWPAAADVAFVPSAPQTGYLCGDLAQVPPTSSQWLYKTTDGGMTWTSVGGITTPTVTVPVTMFCSVFVDANDAHDVFAELVLEYYPAASSETLWRSRDGGATWHQLSMPQLVGGWTAITVVGTRIVALARNGAGVAPLCVAPGSSNTGSPATVDDLYASDDGGTTWNTIGQDLISKGLGITSAGVFYTPGVQSIGTTLFVQTFCETQQGQGFQKTYWRSTDGGDTWTAAAFPAGIIDNMRFTPSPTGSFYGVAVVDTGASVSEPTTSQLLYSSDSGATWKALPPLSTLPGLQSSQFYANNITALPDGSVLADIKAGSALNTAISQIFVVHPEDATPTWQRYAPSEGYGGEGDGGWEIASTTSGLVLWGWHYGASQPAVYLSPLP